MFLVNLFEEKYVKLELNNLPNKYMKSIVLKL